MAPEGDSRPSLGKAPDADGLFRFFKRQVPSPAKAPDAGGLFRFFKKTTVADTSRSSGRDTPGLNTPEAKGLHGEIDSARRKTRNGNDRRLRGSSRQRRDGRRSSSAGD